MASKVNSGRSNKKSSLLNFVTVRFGIADPSMSQDDRSALVISLLEKRAFMRSDIEYFRNSNRPVCYPLLGLISLTYGQ